MARQEQDSARLDRIDSYLSDPRDLVARQSDLRHGLLTPGATPPNRSSLTLSNSPLRREPSIGPSFTRKIYSGSGVCPPPLAPQQTLQCSTNTYTPPSYYSNWCQDYSQYSPYPLYPQHPQPPQCPQTGQISTRNEVELANNFSTQNFHSESQVGFAPKFEMRCNSSNSVQSIESMISSDTNNTVDPRNPDVLTPVGRWDEPAEFCSWEYETKSKASTDSDLPLEFRWAEPMNLMDQALSGCFGTSISPPTKYLSLSVSDTNNFNLHSLQSQSLTVNNLGMNFQLCPLEEAENLPKMDSRSQILLNVLEGYEQSATQPRNITSESGSEHREYQIPASQDGNTLSKPNCDTDIRISIEARPLPCTTRSVSNTRSGREFPYYRRQTSSPSPMTASESETCPWSSDNDTDWGDDEPDDENRTIGAPVIIEGSNVLAEQELPNRVTRPVLSKMKQELVDRLMVEFWQIFNQEQEINRYVSQAHISSEHVTHVYSGTKIAFHRALVCTSVRNQKQDLKKTKTRNQHRNRAQNLTYRLMEPAPSVARMGKGNVKAKMMRMTKAGTEIQRDQRVCYHRLEIEATPASSHVRIESMTRERIAFVTGALVL